jgi:hypothetical protein
MSNVEIVPSEMPESSIDGKYNVRYRLVTEDRNQTSSYSDVKTITLPQITVQLGSLTTGLVMSAVSVTDTVLLSETVPTSAANKLTFTWAPGNNVILDRDQYDLYAYFSSTGSDFNTKTPKFLTSISQSGSNTIDPNSITANSSHVIFVITKKTNIKSIYDFKLSPLGDYITGSSGEIFSIGQSLLRPATSGGSIAVMSSDGNTIAYSKTNESIAIFVKSGSGWVEQASLTPSDTTASDYFGSSEFELSSDGNTLVAGAEGDDTSPNTNNGSAYVFVRNGTTWSQQAKIENPDPATNDSFGAAVSISSDGNTISVGARSDDASPNTNNGAAYIFVRSGTTWTQQQKITANDRQSSANFGHSVKLSSSGNLLFVQQISVDKAIYIFKRTGTTWTQQQKLPNADLVSSYGSPGTSVNMAVNKLEDILVVGTSSSTVGQTGKTYVYRLVSGIWVESQQLIPTIPDTQFGGNGIAISEDSNFILVGGIGYDSPTRTNNGAVFVYQRSATGWILNQMIVEPTTFLFGTSCSFSQNNTALISGSTSSFFINPKTQHNVVTFVSPKFQI